jgi:hypothetical protein
MRKAGSASPGLTQVLRQNIERKQTVQTKEDCGMHVWNEAISANVPFILKALTFIPDLHTHY